MDLHRNESATGSPAGDAVHQASDYLRSHSMDEMADDVRDNVDAVADRTRDKADAVAGTVREKAGEVGTQASAKINDVMSGTGQQLSSLAQAIRKHTTKGPADNATNSTADALERSGRYLQDQDVDGIRGGLEKMIRRYPIPALLISAGISFVLARRIFR
ncbi:hypothetical protein EKD04_025070 [Chloroflexales bacterium ZM16-3]|nr:hypothetical protein [Chloroflexales bacterium ZM16-3]